MTTPGDHGLAVEDDRRIGAAELEGIARVFLTTHGDRVQRWTLHEQGSIRRLVLHSWHPDIPYVMVHVAYEGIILIWSEGDGDYRELDASENDVLTEIGLELSAHIAGGFDVFYSWLGTPIGVRRSDSEARRRDRLLRRTSRALTPWPLFGQRVDESDLRHVEPDTVEGAVVEDVAAIVSAIVAAGSDANDAGPSAAGLEAYIVAQGLVSRAGLSPDDLESWLFTEFCELWSLPFSRSDAAAMRRAVDPALERYRLTPDAGGTALPGWNHDRVETLGTAAAGEAETKSHDASGDEDAEDADLARRVVDGLGAILGDRIHVSTRHSEDFGHWLGLAPRAADPVVVKVWIWAGEVYITDRRMIDEESDDLETDVDRAAWAVKTLADLARFGAARIRHRRFVPRSWNRLHIFESTAARQEALAAAQSRVVSTLLPFALVPRNDDLAEMRARLARGETVFVEILDGEFSGARLNLFPLEREHDERQFIDIDVDPAFEEQLGISDGAVLSPTQSVFDDLLAGRRLRLLNREQARDIVRALWGPSRPAWGDIHEAAGSADV